jgi:hypothetical protein
MSELGVHIEDLTKARKRFEDTVQLRLVQISPCFLDLQQHMLEPPTRSTEELYVRAVEHFRTLATHRKELRELVQPIGGDLAECIGELWDKSTRLH